MLLFDKVRLGVNSAANLFDGPRAARIVGDHAADDCLHPTQTSAHRCFLMLTGRQEETFILSKPIPEETLTSRFPIPLTSRRHKGCVHCASGSAHR